ncbi:CBS domain-containing protein CBSX3, mitochondrial-like isoform X1 [Camellia sinensis]|uniref:CBS domain-containing protein CBSX3, mitochondrial-like isoform X1 n=1 Tax=Camellia sinensis TaxID=4442 RepID=UPI0010361ABB|nr:CBS domain-containing protein CBSX3, mitochondrial-like isoform X1 [Camellia sinensis]XP_028088445.1 CBS domain-containing protein CBSX3, mitochondrial-like isoform X1 [Camellia sinensis]
MATVTATAEDRGWRRDTTQRQGKIVAMTRPSKYTRVGEIMTDQHKLITVTSDTNILQAIQLMTENHIRHVPVIDGKIVGMISIVDVVRAMVEQQSGEVNKLNEFIKGEYYC